MDCTKAQKLISIHVASEESWLDPEERRALEAHMAACAPCRRDCREAREVVALLRACCQISADTAALLAQGRPSRRRGGFARVVRLLGSSRRVAVWATAACLVLGLLGTGVSFRGPASWPGSDRPVALTDADPSLLIESADGSRIAPGTILQTSHRQTESLVLNGRHRVVMNAGARLSVASLVAGRRAGCRIDLAAGEIYVQVEHDGNPFVVQTLHGRAVITGTTFDMQVTAAGTTLTVAEGSVRFESAVGAVQVVAGQQSMIAAASGLPGSPAMCDAARLTAWARPDRAVNEIAPVVVQDGGTDTYALGSLSPLPSVSPRVQIDLDRIEYARWVEQNREWFRGQFPWVFALSDALSRRGTEVDYPELLLRSGDIWRFVYVKERPEQFSWPDPNSLLAVGQDYGLDRPWLSQHVPAVGGAGELGKASARDSAGLEGLERWLEESCSAADRTPAGIWHSYRAAQYLVQTRTLAWLAIRDGRCDVPQKHRTEVLELLRKVILAGYEWQYEELCVPPTRDAADCDKPISKRDSAKAVLAPTIRAGEEALAEYVRPSGLATRRPGAAGRP